MLPLAPCLILYRHFESEKEKYWEIVREGDVKREGEQVRERTQDIDEEKERRGKEEEVEIGGV